MSTAVAIDPAADPSTATLTAAAVLSMLHESADRNSATRLFRGRPVLAWTLDRLARSERLGAVVVLCWDDQAAAVQGVLFAHDEGSREGEPPGEPRSAARTEPRPPQCAGPRVQVISKGSRIAIPQLDAIAASRRWADGWRGGLLGTCAFDQGFVARWVLDAIESIDGVDAVLLLDPAAGFADSALVDATIEHADAHPKEEFCFAPAAPGLSGPLLRRSLLERLAAGGSHPGQLLHYHPDRISREMLAQDSCVPIAASLARTTRRFDLASTRQMHRIDEATARLNGEARSIDGERLVALTTGQSAPDRLPRDVVLELRTERLSRPIFWPGTRLAAPRGPMSLDVARSLIDQLAKFDDTRLTLAGVGDPLLAPDLLSIIEYAGAAGVAVHVETDLLETESEPIRALARSSVDVVSVHLPAITDRTYAAIMGVDAYRQVLQNIQTFVAERAAAGRAVPILAPLFVKCRENLGEMEAWYDQWLRAVGSAVIVSPSDYGRLIPEAGVADMAPPRRVACRRLENRMTVLADGRVVSCEQDILGQQVMGDVRFDRLDEIWQQRFATLRAAHARQEWGACALCAGCREWHRP